MSEFFFFSFVLSCSADNGIMNECALALATMMTTSMATVAGNDTATVLSAKIHVKRA